jgi:hypothetical protein
MIHVDVVYICCTYSIRSIMTLVVVITPSIIAYIILGTVMSTRDIDLVSLLKLASVRTRL